MPDMHTKGYLRVAAIAAEVTFSDQDADEVSDFELRRHRRLLGVSPSCYTGNHDENGLQDDS
jgi:hypothetical protein